MRAFRISKKRGKDVLTLDLLVVSPVLSDVWKNRQSFEVDDRTLTVVSRSGLVAMKKLAGRKQDQADLENLGISDDG